MKSVYVVALYNYKNQAYEKLMGFCTNQESARNEANQLNENLPWVIFENMSFVVQEVVMYEQ